jgi:hypothetical protein
MEEVKAFRPRTDSESTIATLNWSSRLSDGPDDESDAPEEKPEANLSMLHACVHCRSSKTACSDQRPCNRCHRLGLDCSSDGGQPRKRACKSCHVAKVACGTFHNDTCNRCRRLGFECVPRDPPMHGSRRKRMRLPTTDLADAAIAAGSAHLSATLPITAYRSSASPMAGRQGRMAEVVGAVTPSTSLAAHLAPLDLNHLSNCAYEAGAPHGAPLGVVSPGGVSNMISVAASLLDLSRPAAEAEHAAARSDIAAALSSPRLMGAAAFLGALATTPLLAADGNDDAIDAEDAERLQSWNPFASGRTLQSLCDKLNPPARRAAASS